MIPRLFQIILSLPAAFFLGCSPSIESRSQQQAEKPADATAKASGPKLRSVDNPNYLTWSKFPIGTHVVRVNKLINDKGTVTVTTSLKLHSIDKNIAKVESQITVERPTDLTANPPQILDYLAKQSVLESTTDEQVAAPLKEAKLLRTESIAVLGREFQAKVYTWKTALESGPADVLGWYSDEFPGRQIKQEIDFGEGGKGTEEITRFDIPVIDIPVTSTPQP